MRSQTDDNLTLHGAPNLRLLFCAGLRNLLSLAIETRLTHYQASSRLGSLIEWRYVGDDGHANALSSQYVLRVNGGPEAADLNAETFTVLLVVKDNNGETLCSEPLSELLQALAQRS